MTILQSVLDFNVIKLQQNYVKNNNIKCHLQPAEQLTSKGSRK